MCACGSVCVCVYVCVRACERDLVGGGLVGEALYDYITFGAPAAHAYKFRNGVSLRQLVDRWVSHFMFRNPLNLPFSLGSLSPSPLTLYPSLIHPHLHLHPSHPSCAGIA